MSDPHARLEPSSERTNKGTSQVNEVLAIKQEWDEHFAIDYSNMNESELDAHMAKAQDIIARFDAACDLNEYTKYPDYYRWQQEVGSDWIGVPNRHLPVEERAAIRYEDTLTGTMEEFTDWLMKPRNFGRVLLWTSPVWLLILTGLTHA